MEWMIVFAVIVVLLLLFSCLKIVPEAKCFVIEFLGTYKCTWQSGLHFKIPFLERISKKVSMKEQVADFPPQPVITKDNVTMNIDTVVYYKIFDPKLYTYGVEQPVVALEYLTTTSLRNIVGDLELDQTLTSRDLINAQMRDVLDVATDPWGIKVHRVELKNIIPPQEIQQAMEKQMRPSGISARRFWRRTRTSSRPSPEQRGTRKRRFWRLRRRRRPGSLWQRARRSPSAGFMRRKPRVWSG